MLLMIDNYDSFTYNLVQYFGVLGQQVEVFRNDQITLTEIERLAPDYLVVSPGPCSPREAGISVPVIQHFAGRIPLLGVCLGHQAMGFAFGGEVVRAKTLMHGKVSPVFHEGQGLFRSLPNPFQATRYHSLAVRRDTLPDCFEITAWTEDGEIMGMRHREFAMEGVQYHPESILTEFGYDMLRNFLENPGGVEHLRELAELFQAEGFGTALGIDAQRVPGICREGSFQGAAQHLAALRKRLSNDPGQGDGVTLGTFVGQLGNEPHHGRVHLGGGVKAWGGTSSRASIWK